MKSTILFFCSVLLLSSGLAFAESEYEISGDELEVQVGVALDSLGWVASKIILNSTRRMPLEVDKDGYVSGRMLIEESAETLQERRGLQTRSSEVVVSEVIFRFSTISKELELRRVDNSNFVPAADFFSNPQEAEVNTQSYAEDLPTEVLVRMIEQRLKAKGEIERELFLNEHHSSVAPSGGAPAVPIDGVDVWQRPSKTRRGTNPRRD